LNLPVGGASLAAALLLQGCVLPRTVATYDPDCQVVVKKMVLDVAQVNLMSSGCTSARCTEQLVIAGVVLATSAVVSGSIVLVGNVVYWMEKQRDCQGPASAAVVAPPAI
jgi:hypothetical protein